MTVITKARSDVKNTKRFVQETFVAFGFLRGFVKNRRCPNHAVIN